MAKKPMSPEVRARLTERRAEDDRSTLSRVHLGILMAAVDAYHDGTVRLPPGTSIYSHMLRIVWYLPRTDLRPYRATWVRVLYADPAQIEFLKRSLPTLTVVRETFSGFDAGTGERATKLQVFPVFPADAMMSIFQFIWGPPGAGRERPPNRKYLEGYTESLARRMADRFSRQEAASSAPRSDS